MVFVDLNDVGTNGFMFWALRWHLSRISLRLGYFIQRLYANGAKMWVPAALSQHCQQLPERATSGQEWNEGNTVSNWNLLLFQLPSWRRWQQCIFISLSFFLSLMKVEICDYPELFLISSLQQQQKYRGKKNHFHSDRPELGCCIRRAEPRQSTKTALNRVLTLHRFLYWFSSHEVSIASC